MRANMGHHANGCFSYTSIFSRILVTGFYTYPGPVGEFKSAEIFVSHMPSLKAKKLGMLAQEKVLLEP
jgi:hypothetical protein